MVRSTYIHPNGIFCPVISASAQTETDVKSYGRNAQWAFGYASEGLGVCLRRLRTLLERRVLRTPKNFQQEFDCMFLLAV